MQTEGLQQASKRVKRGLRHSLRGWLLPIRPYAWSASFLYLFELIFGLFWLVAISAWWLLPVFVAAILALFLIDRVEYQRYGDKTPERMAILLLALRFICVELAILIAPSLTPMLYLLFPFRAMLYFGRKAAYGMTALIVIAYFAFFWLDPRSNHDSISVIFAFIFCVACIWSVSMTHTISLERESQQREHMRRLHTEELLEEITRSHQQLHIYAEQVATLAAAEERNRVARDIHDGLGHALTAIHLQLEKALMYYDASPQEARQSVQDARDVAKVALQDVRRSVRTLRTEGPPFSCVREVTLLAEQLRKNGLVVDFVCEGDEGAFSRQTLTTLYRVAQEGCTNIQRHAQASHVHIHLDFGAQEAHLCLDDDGIGFNTSSILKQDSGHMKSYGLQGMLERLSLVNGSLRLDSSPGQGTQLLVLVPRQVTRNLSGEKPLVSKEI